MVEVLLDASAFLAWSLRETGEERVDEVLPAAGITSVNAAETVSKLQQLGAEPEVAREAMTRSGIVVLAFSADDAWTCAAIHVGARHAGLSIGDCACLGAARCRDLPVLTADRIWRTLNIGVSVEVIR